MTKRSQRMEIRKQRSEQIDFQASGQQKMDLTGQTDDYSTWHSNELFSEKTSFVHVADGNAQRIGSILSVLQICPAHVHTQSYYLSGLSISLVTLPKALLDVKKCTAVLVIVL